MKFIILFLCLICSGPRSFASTKTVYYKADYKIIDHQGKATSGHSIGKIDVSPQKLEFLDYMYGKIGQPIVTTKNYLQVVDQKHGTIYWIIPQRKPFDVDLTYTDGKLTGQSASFKDPAGRPSEFKSTLTDNEYSYSLNVFDKDRKKVYSMVSDGKMIGKDEFEKTLKEIKPAKPKGK